jgi:uncharacterized repeat protein (TIGR01451 family)
MAHGRRLAATAGAAILTLGIAGAAAAGSQLSAGSDRMVAAGEACGIEPLDVEIILDNSLSMSANSSGGKTRLEWAKLSAKQLVDDLDGSGIPVGGSGHHVGVTRFSGTTASVVQSLDPSGDDDADAVKDAIDGLAASGNTPVDAGMATGAGDLTANGRSGVKSVLIILSDGRPWPDQGPEGTWATTSGPRPNASEGAAYLASADVKYSVALGTGGTNGTANEIDLPLMALLGPNGAYNVVTGGELPDVFSDIYEQIACPAELSAAKEVDKSHADPGDTLNYTITVQNTGGSDATGVDVHDDISSLLAYGAFGTCDHGCTHDADSVDWDDLTVPMGGDVELHFSIDLATDGWPVGTTHLPNTVVVSDTNCHVESQDGDCSTDTQVEVFEQSQEPETDAPPTEEPSQVVETEEPSQVVETEEPSFEQSQEVETDEPSFEETLEVETELPSLPDTTTRDPIAAPSTDGAWGLIVALAALVAGLYVISPRSARRRR